MSDLLFIKTSSLGDVIHHMPAITELRRHQPQARISWLVEEAFAPLVRLHAGVDVVIPVASRRWRRELHRLSTWREMMRRAPASRRRPDFTTSGTGSIAAGTRSSAIEC